jgi:hypothetical protein
MTIQPTAEQVAAAKELMINLPMGEVLGNVAALLAERDAARAAVEVAEAAAKYRDAETTVVLCGVLLSNRQDSRDELREATEAVLGRRDALDAAIDKYRAAKANGAGEQREQEQR